MDDRVPSIDNVDGPNSSNWKVWVTTLVKAWRLWKKHWSLPGTLPRRQVLVTQVEDHVVRVARVLCSCCEVCQTRFEASEVACMAKGDVCLEACVASGDMCTCPNCGTVIKLQLTRKCSSRTRTNMLWLWEAWTYPALLSHEFGMGRSRWCL